jgi:hypothetical protein
VPLVVMLALQLDRKYMSMSRHQQAERNSELEIGNKGKGKVIPVTSREGQWGCERPSLPHFLDSRLTDGGKFVSLTHRLPFTPQEDSWYSFLLGAESTPGPKCGWKDYVN